jgi:hypothetical protein
MMHTAFIGWLSLVVLLSVSHSARAESATGAVCIDTIYTGGSWEGNHTGAVRSSTFTVQIGDHEPVSINSRLSAEVTDLALDSRHLVKIRLEGKLLTSFTFSFREKGSNHLRLWYKEMYGTWSLSTVEKPSECDFWKAKR